MFIHAWEHVCKKWFARYLTLPFLNTFSLFGFIFIIKLKICPTHFLLKYSLTIVGLAITIEDQIVRTTWTCSEYRTIWIELVILFPNFRYNHILHKQKVLLFFHTYHLNIFLWINVAATLLFRNYSNDRKLSKNYVNLSKL